MALQIQVWRPDTCGCVIEQTHDPADGTVAVGLSRVLQRCPAHALLDDQAVWDAVWSFATGENRRKNRMRNRIMEQYGIEIVSFSFSGQGSTRVLTIVTSGLSPSQRTAAQGWADATFGAGTVVIS